MHGIRVMCTALALSAAPASQACSGDAPPARAEEGVEPVPGDEQKPRSRRGPIRTLGDWGQFVNPAAAAAISLSEDDPDGLKQLARGCFYTIAGTSVLKRIFNLTPLGERPDGGDNSFPSGHAAAAMCAPAYLHERYEQTRYTAPLTATGAFVMYSRVWARKHAWHDVLASAALAMAVAHNTTSYRSRERKRPSLTSLSQVPPSAPATGGVGLLLIERGSHITADQEGSTGRSLEAGLELEPRASADSGTQSYIGFRVQGRF